jgi:hypothetical protein
MWQSRQSWRDLNDSAEKSRTAKKTTDDTTHASVNGQYCNWFETLYLTQSHSMRRTFRTRTAFIFLWSKHLCHYFFRIFFSLILFLKWKLRTFSRNILLTKHYLLKIYQRVIYAVNKFRNKLITVLNREFRNN